MCPGWQARTTFQVNNMFDTTPQLDCAGRILKLDRPRVLGIINVTPDSFSDGGEHATVERSEEHTSELQSLMRISYAVFCLKKKKPKPKTHRQKYPNVLYQTQY